VEAPTPQSTGGDVRLTVRVQYGDFAGAADAWVLLEVWDAFLADLRSFERRRHGEARVRSLSPGELVLRIFATDRAGHLAVEGEVGTLSIGREALLRFGPIAFDPSLLPQLIAELSE
jgi:hypothetical protein